MLRSSFVQGHSGATRKLGTSLACKLAHYNGGLPRPPASHLDLDLATMCRGVPKGTAIEASSHFHDFYHLILFREKRDFGLMADFGGSGISWHTIGFDTYGSTTHSPLPVLVMYNQKQLDAGQRTSTTLSWHRARTLNTAGEALFSGLPSRASQ